MNQKAWLERAQGVLWGCHASAEGNPNRLAALATDLVKREVDVIYASGPRPGGGSGEGQDSIVFWGLAPPNRGWSIRTHAPEGNVTGSRGAIRM